MKVKVAPKPTYQQSIMLTCPCNENPLTPHFYIVKLGLTGVYNCFIFALNHRLWVLVRTASIRLSYRVPTIYVLSKNKTDRLFHLKISHFTDFQNRCIMHGYVCVIIRTDSNELFRLDEYHPLILHQFTFYSHKNRFYPVFNICSILKQKNAYDFRHP